MTNTDKWESGELGRDLAHAVRVPEEDVGVDEALGLQLISIRLQKKLINDLKMISGAYGIGYQPMIRDLLNRFVESEIKQMANARLAELKAERERNATEPVNVFMSKQA